MTSPLPNPEPPRLSRAMLLVLRTFLSADERAAVLSELRELWEARRARYGDVAARRWYARQMRAYPVRLVGERLRALFAGGGLRAHGPSRPEVAPAGFRLDVRHSARGLLRSPGVAVTVILTVGLGLGTSVAMLAVVRTVLADVLPYGEADRLVRIYHALGANRWNLSVADFQAIEAQQTHFDAVAAYTSNEQTLTSGIVAERVRVRGVTPGWFDLVGIRVRAGRTFAPTDGEPGAPPTAVVSWGFSDRVLGGIDSALGRTIRLDGASYTVVGVLPRDVGPLEERFEVFPALQFEPPQRKGPFTLTVVGRLREGAAMEVAGAELRAINRRIFPLWQPGWQDSTATWGVMPLDEFVAGRFRAPLLVLLGAVALVLAIASTNAAGLLTARAVQRRTELATRAALGASRAHLIRLLVTDGILLAIAAALVGFAIALAAVQAVRAAGPDLLPRAGTLTVDGFAVGMLALLALGSFLVYGILPALQLAGGGAIGESLRSSGRTTTTGGASHSVRRALVAAQFAIAVPLLAGAALLLNSFVRLQRVDSGFDAEGLLTVGIARTGARYGDDEGAQFWEELLRRVEALPGVVAAGLNNGRPPREGADINNFDPLDRPTPPGESEPGAVWLVASPGYFEAAGVRLLAGRMFDARDVPDLGTTSALVDRTWVENVYPGEDPIGRQLYEGGCRSEDCTVVNVVGVVEDVRYLGLDDSQTGAAVGTVYVPQSQWLASSSYLFVRTTGDPLRTIAPIREIVRELDPGIPIEDVATGEQLVDAALAAPRNIASVVAAFAVVALVLAMIGIYGVMSYFVQQHRREIGVRLALGGRPSQVRALVLGRGMKPVLAGTAIGFIVASVAMRNLQRLLFDVSPYDPGTLAIAAAALIGTAALACWLPARRAAALQPITALTTD